MRDQNTLLARAKTRDVRLLWIVGKPTIAHRVAGAHQSPAFFKG